MKQGQYLTSVEGRRYISISENLRSCLEVKLDELYKKGKLDVYVSTCGIKPIPTDEELVGVLIGHPFNDEIFARLICRAVKTWYGMYYDDRRSVLEKFRCYCKLCFQNKGIFHETDFTFIFIRVLIAEFTTELSDVKWSLLVSRRQQGFAAKDH
jgi:hypothetical protein